MTQAWRLTAAVAMLSVATAGCSTRSESGTTRSSAKTITTAEMQASGHQDAYSLVQSLRPQWLRVRGTSSFNLTETVQVYLDGSRLGGPDHLRQISTHSISSLRYLDGLEATQRWGLDHGAGAIVVSTRERTDSSYD